MILELLRGRCLKKHSDLNNHFQLKVALCHLFSLLSTYIMPAVNDKYTIVSANINPNAEIDQNFTSSYTRRSKTFFLIQMIRNLSAGGKRLYNFEDGGSLPHRFLDAIATELARMDRSWYDSLARAARNAVYYAFQKIGDFPARQSATFAAGYGTFTRSTPAPTDEIIPIGTVIAALTGETAVTSAAVTVLAGTTSASVIVRSQVPGIAGNIRSGDLKQVLSSIGPYTFRNTTPLDGGQEEESDEQIAERFLAYIKTLRTGSRDSVYQKAINTSITVGLSTVKPRDVAIIEPWFVPELNMPGGLFYVVVEEGGGVCSPALLTAVGNNVNSVTSVGTRGISISSSAYAINLAITYSYFNTVSSTNVESSISSSWNNYLNDSLVEDGTGRGEVNLLDLATVLKSSNTAIVGLSITNVTSQTIKPLLGSRAIPGTLTFTSASI